MLNQPTELLLLAVAQSSYFLWILCLLFIYTYLMFSIAVLVPDNKLSFNFFFLILFCYFILKQLEYDILEYVVIERLAQSGRDKLKDDGLNLSDWLQSLASFWGHLYVQSFLVIVLIIIIIIFCRSGVNNVPVILFIILNIWSISFLNSVFIVFISHTSTLIATFVLNCIRCWINFH